MLFENIPLSPPVSPHHALLTETKQHLAAALGKAEGYRGHEIHPKDLHGGDGQCEPEKQRDDNRHCFARVCRQCPTDDLLDVVVDSSNKLIIACHEKIVYAQTHDAVYCSSMTWTQWGLSSNQQRDQACS